MELLSSEKGKRAGVEGIHDLYYQAMICILSGSLGDFSLLFNWEKDEIQINLG